MAYNALYMFYGLWDYFFYVLQPLRNNIIQQQKKAMCRRDVCTRRVTGFAHLHRHTGDLILRWHFGTNVEDL